MSIESRQATRERLLEAARSQFAERGFYGASIAQIAGELDLTKQALLYHFKRKEDLYSEVLKDISERLQKAMALSAEASSSPEEQFERMMLGVFDTACDSPLDTKILMRELIDNQRRDTPPEEWYLKRFLDSLLDRLDAIEAVAGLSRAQKLARIYMIMSAIEYFAASEAVLNRFYGAAEYESISRAYRDDLRSQVHRLISGN